MTIKQLEAIAIERFGSIQAAALMAQRECDCSETIIRNKAPWIKAIQKPLDVEDLGKIATHETWVKEIRERLIRKL